MPIFWKKNSFLMTLSLPVIFFSAGVSPSCKRQPALQSNAGIKSWTADSALLSDIEAPTETPPADFSAEMFIQNAGKYFFSFALSPYDKNPFTDVSPSELFQSFNVLSYEKKLESIGRKVKPLAAASVLDILRKNRTAFAVKGARGIVQDDDFRGTLQVWKESPWYKLDTPKLLALGIIPDASRPFATTSCNHWDKINYSDIKWHYYCSIPVVFRACHRILIGKHFDRNAKSILAAASMTDVAPMKLLSDLGNKDFELVLKYCNDPSSLPAGVDKEDFDAALAAEELVPENKLKPGDLSRFFAAFYKSQKTPAGVNIYDYIMRSQPYAFSYEQQQAVLNTYYSEMSPTNDFDPSDPDSCKLYRDRRTTIVEKSMKNHCDVAEPKSNRFWTPGR